MHSSSRLPALRCSHAERGGYSVLGCAPFGLQRAIEAPRSDSAGLGRGSHKAFAVRQALHGEQRLSARFSAAKTFFLTPSRKPNPAYERTCLRQAAQGQR